MRRAVHLHTLSEAPRFPPPTRQGYSVPIQAQFLQVLVVQQRFAQRVLVAEGRWQLCPTVHDSRRLIRRRQ
jgi:hypothetical protein